MNSFSSSYGMMSDYPVCITLVIKVPIPGNMQSRTSLLIPLISSIHAIYTVILRSFQYETAVFSSVLFVPYQNMSGFTFQNESGFVSEHSTDIYLIITKYGLFCSKQPLKTKSTQNNVLRNTLHFLQMLQNTLHFLCQKL